MFPKGCAETTGFSYSIHGSQYGTLYSPIWSPGAKPLPLPAFWCQSTPLNAKIRRVGSATLGGEPGLQRREMRTNTNRIPLRKRPGRSRPCSRRGGGKPHQLSGQEGAPKPGVVSTAPFIRTGRAPLHTPYSVHMRSAGAKLCGRGWLRGR